MASLHSRVTTHFITKFTCTLSNLQISKNKVNKESNTVLRRFLFFSDAWITWAADFAASLLASMTVYAVLGAMAKTAQMAIDKLPIAGKPSSFINDPSISTIFQNTVYLSAQGLAFVVYPELVSQMMVPQLWLFAFFFTLFILRIDNQVRLHECFLYHTN